MTTREQAQSMTMHESMTTREQDDAESMTTYTRTRARTRAECRVYDYARAREQDESMTIHGHRIYDYASARTRGLAESMWTRANKSTCARTRPNLCGPMRARTRRTANLCGHMRHESMTMHRANKGTSLCLLARTRAKVYANKSMWTHPCMTCEQGESMSTS